MLTDAHPTRFQRALVALYRQYLADIGPRRVAAFVDSHGTQNGGQPPTLAQIAAGVDVVGSAAGAEYFLEAVKCIRS